MTAARAPRQPVPWLAISLIAANLVAAFWATLDPTVIERLGLRPSHITVTTLFASPFLHVNLLHLLGNMVFLAACGPSVEVTAQAWRFGIVYAVGGVAGALAHALMAGPGSTQPLVGASGCVAAVIGYFAVQHHAMKVPLAPRVQAPLTAIVAAWVVLQALGAFVSVGESQGGVAFWAHLGGLLAGLLLSVIFRVPRLSQIQAGHDLMTEMSDRSPAAALAAAERHLARHPGDTRAMHEVAEAHRALGDTTKETEALRAILLGGGPERVRATTRLAEIGGLQSIPSMERARLAESLKSMHPEAAIVLLASLVCGPSDDPQRPDALLALATLQAPVDPDGADTLVRRLLDEYPMHPAADVARARGLGR